MKTKTLIPLSEMPRKNAFKVPNTYFEELPTAVLLRCSVSEVKNKPLRASKPFWWSIAASIVLLLGIWFVVPNISSPLDSSKSLSQVFQSSDHFQNYLAFHVEPILLEHEISFSDVDFYQDQGFTQDEALNYVDHFDLTDDDILNE
ncbi:MAG: hypothetical protein LBU91_05640 [Bacteroidales bacterium]|jgi:hypothetical protein|nr:hypothetical protein [Bacteroidales bacterium]